MSKRDARRPRPASAAASRPGKPGGPRPAGDPVAAASAIRLAEVPAGSGYFELDHPACVFEREPDYREGLELWKAGDPEEARDALRYALEGCASNLWVHAALGRIALEAFNDPQLARGHLGYAVELARQALPAGFAGRLPRQRPANAPFYDAVDGLAQCLRKLGKSADADRLTAFARRLENGAGGGPGRPLP